VSKLFAPGAPGERIERWAVDLSGATAVGERIER